jgi:hypothetical protein
VAHVWHELFVLVAAVVPVDTVKAVVLVDIQNYGLM